MTFSTKLKDRLVANLPGYIATALAATATFLFTWAMPDAWDRFATWFIAISNPKVVVAILAMSMMFAVVLLAFLVPLLMEDKKTLLGGIYWDKKKTPYCPSCKTPVSKYGDFNYGDKGYWCNVCKAVFTLADASGNSIEPEAARRQL